MSHLSRNIEQLQQELAKIDDKINSLTNTKNDIMNTIRELTYVENLEMFNVKWNLKPGEFLALFTKTLDNTFFMIKTFEVTEVDSDALVAYGVMGGYHMYQYDYEFKCVETSPLTVGSMPEYEYKYNIYVIDAVQHALLLQKLCSLKINASNMEEYHKAIQSVADRKIS